MSAKWNDLLLKYWPNAYWCKTNDDVIVVLGELGNKFGPYMPKNEELCEVVRYMAGPECDLGSRAPSLRQLIMFICKYRKPGGGSTGKTELTSCQNCLHGWMSPWTNLHPGHRWQVPCNCESGNYIVEKFIPYRDYSDEQLMRLATIRADAQYAVQNNQRMDWARYQSKDGER